MQVAFVVFIDPPANPWRSGRVETTERITVEPIGRWGKFPTYAAKIGSMGSSCVLVKRMRSFAEGDLIEYCNERDLRGMRKSCTPRWERGTIWLISDNRLFINR